jgi:hypothetical protein
MSCDRSNLIPFSFSFSFSFFFSFSFSFLLFLRNPYFFSKAMSSHKEEEVMEPDDVLIEVSPSSSSFPSPPPPPPDAHMDTPSPPPHQGDTVDVILINGTSVTVTLERYENIRCAFEVSDLDQSGFLEREEVVQVLEKVCGGGQEKPLTMEEIESVIEAVDYNDDGKISFEEFLDFVLRIQSDPSLSDGGMWSHSNLTPPQPTLNTH